MSVLLVKDFDILRLNIGKGGEITYGKTKEPLYLQTPELYAPFGVSVFEDSSHVEVTVETQPFFDVIVSIDNKVLQTCTDNSKEWFGEQLKREDMFSRFKPLIKMSDKYPPMTKIKLSDKDPPKIFRGPNNAVDLEHLTKGTFAKYIVSIRSVWSLGGSFGTSMRMKQAVITRERQASAFAFVEEEEV